MNNGNNQRNFSEIGGGSTNPRWEPQKSQFDSNNPPYMDGYFVRSKELKGKKGPFNVYEFHPVDAHGNLTDTKVDVAGGFVFEDKMNQVRVGSFVRVQYEGKGKSKSTGNDVNYWKILVDQNALPYEKVVGGAPVPPVINTPQAQIPQQQAPFNGTIQNGNNTNGQPVFNQNQQHTGQPVIAQPANGGGQFIPSTGGGGAGSMPMHNNPFNQFPAGAAPVDADDLPF